MRVLVEKQYKQFKVSGLIQREKLSVGELQVKLIYQRSLKILEQNVR